MHSRICTVAPFLADTVGYRHSITVYPKITQNDGNAKKVRKMTYGADKNLSASQNISRLSNLLLFFFYFSFFIFVFINQDKPPSGIDSQNYNYFIPPVYM